MQQQIIKSSTATVQKGVARVDGKFSVTESEISFEPFNHDSVFGPYHFARDAIVSVKKCKGMGAGILPLTKEAIELKLQDDTTYEFIIADSDDWVALFS